MSDFTAKCPVENTWKYVSCRRIIIFGGDAADCRTSSPNALLKALGNTYHVDELLAAGSYALAAPYDATADGTYFESPVQTTFVGVFEGFGNAISNLSIKNKTKKNGVGLFYLNYGVISHLGLLHADVVGDQKGNDSVGPLAASNAGFLFQDFATGRVSARGPNSLVGGLVGATGSADISIDQSYADVRVEGGGKGKLKRTFGAGGLVGWNLEGEIRQSFAIGSTNVEDTGIAGGLVAVNSDSAIEDCYATGSVNGGQSSTIGGLIGAEAKYIDASETVNSSYSTGAVSGGESSLVGGFVGTSTKESHYTDAYWDTTTSGTSRASGKGKARNVEGLSTDELQSGLPAGFDPSVWGENAKINNGMPYLLTNPPPK